MTTELKESRISTRVTKLLKVDIDNTAKQMNIKPAELLREAVEAYLSQADVHVELDKFQKANETLERDRKVALDKYVAKKKRVSALEAELESVKFDLNIAKTDKKNLGNALMEMSETLQAVSNRGFFRRLFNLKPKQPKPVETEA